MMSGKGRRVNMPSMIIHTKSAVRPANVCCSSTTPYRPLREHTQRRGGRE